VSSQTDTWFKFALHQVAAESYLDGIAWANPQQVRARLFQGNTRPDVPASGHTRAPDALGRIFTNSNYSIVAHRANDSTGFSGTLLQWTNEQGAIEYTLSLRSTEFKPFDEGGDRERDNLSGANGEVVGSGFAIGQLAALEDFYQREVLPVVGATKINVTGYSLGGHLATVFTETHSDQVRAAYVFNSAGRGQIVGEGGTSAERMAGMIGQFRATLVSEPIADVLNGLPPTMRDAYLPLYQSALRAHLADPGWNPFAPSDASVYGDPRYRWAKVVTSTLGSHPTGPATFPRAGLGTAGDGLITSIYGSALKADSTLVANSQIHASNKRAVYIEGQPFVEGLPGGDKSDFGNTHAITLIVDSLALMREFQRIDPNLSQAQIELLISASSAMRAKLTAPLADANAAEGDSLEKSFLALRRAFDAGATEVRSEAKPGAFSDIGNRQSYYEDLARLPQEGTYRIEVLAGKSVAQIKLLAQRADDTGRAVRYALRQLESFAVVGGNYDNSRFPNGEVDLYNPSTGRGLSEKWIEARSRLLETLARYNVADGDLSVAQIGDFFQEQSRNITLGSPQPGRARIIFGSDANEQALIGFDRDDMIFGGANGEAITVNAGKDYVEGGGGIDIIDGGPGSDELHGGAGNDGLTGGADSDKLYGGAGFDTYIYAAGDGQDQIFDSDGLGRIIYKGRELNGGSRTGRFEYTDSAGVKYELVGSGTGPRSLVIDGKLTVRNFSSGQLNIVLEGEPAGPERPEVDATRTYTLFNEIGEGLPFPTDQSDGGRLSRLVNIYGSDANDSFTYADDPVAFPGFYGRGGDDVVTVAGEIGAATVSGGAGTDVIDASASTSLGGPFLAGGGGDDFILGGAAGETIWGDNYRVQEQFQFFPGFAAPSSSSSYLIDHFIVNLRDAYPNPPPDMDPATLDILANAGAYYYDYGAGGGPLPGYVINNESENLLQYLQIEGWLDLGNLAAAVDYVLGTNATFDDFIDGGAGNDIIKGGSGADEILGGAGNDSIDGDQNAAVGSLGALASRFGEPGDDLLDGGEGNDTLSDLLGGNDTFIGGAGNDVIRSDEGVWSLDPLKAAFNYFDCGDGDDQILSSNVTRDGYDIVDGGAGNDTLFIVSEGGGTILGADGNDAITALTSTGVFDVDGGAGNDTYFVTKGVIRDESGDDSLSLWLASPESVDDTFDALVRGLSPMPADFSHQEVIRRGNDLVIHHQTSAGQGSDSALTIVDWFAGDAPPIEHVRFAGEAPPIVLPPLPGFPPLGPLPPSGGDLSLGRLEAWGSFAIGSSADEDFAGGEHRDRVLAGGGNDFVSTGDGEDVIAGGTGNDVLDGGDGNDTYYYALGDGNDLIADESGDDRLVFAAGIGAADVAVSSIGASSLFLSVAGSTIELEGSAADNLAIERLVFAGGQEVAVSSLLEATVALDGAEGNDFLGGNAEANVIAGGLGDDVLTGGAGDDTYLFNIGDGVDHITDLASADQSNVVRFGPGISADSLTLGLGSLQILVGDGGDAIHLDGVDPNDILGAHDVDLFEFDDGTRLTYAELLARGLDLNGTPFDDIIAGSSIADRVRGLGGDDVLVDGLGDDTYYFGRGDGADAIVEQGSAVGGMDRLVFSTGISMADVSVLEAGDDLVLELNNGGGSVTVQAARLFDVLESVQFADGGAWSASMLREQVGSNSNPDPIDGSGVGEPPATPETSVSVIDVPPATVPIAATPETSVAAIDVPPAPALVAPSPARREGAAETVEAPMLAEARAERVGVPADPLFREMQERFDVLLQAGRANLGERYAEAIREFEQRRIQREEALPPPPPTDEEVEAWNTAMHAWHAQNTGFGETELGAADGGWTMGWGLSGGATARLEGSAGLPGLANPYALLRLTGASAAPGLQEGVRPIA
jgi:Ca2+-binding RTX toxin-like protein